MKLVIAVVRPGLVREKNTLNTFMMCVAALAVATLSFAFVGYPIAFDGGIPVEMGSGFSALAAALVVGARKDYGRQALLPHNAMYVLVGAGLLWFGWFGFNGGSGFGVNDAGVLAFVNTC